MFTFGTLTVGERTYSLEDAKRIVLAKQFGLGDDFYGGRITHIGLTDDDVVLLMPDANSVIDTGAKVLDNIPMSTIRQLCNRRKIKIWNGAAKHLLVEKLYRHGGIQVEKENSETSEGNEG